MKRRLLIVAVFLLSGAVVNVAVAWGCAAWARAVGLPTPANQLPQDPFITKGFGYTELTRITVLDPNTNLLLFKLAPSSYSFQPHDSVVRAGFPLRTYTCVITEDGQIEAGLDLRHMNIPWTSQNRRVLPLRPIWSGFAVNTTFYDAFLWLLICGPFVLRRFIRVRRGLCPACAYPIGESDVCSECGKTLPKRAKVAT